MEIGSCPTKLAERVISEVSDLEWLGMAVDVSSLPTLSHVPAQVDKFLVRIEASFWYVHWSSPRCQGASETGNVSRPSAHGTPTDLWDRRSRGWVPAECLEQKMRRKLSSHFAQVLLYI